MVLRVRAPHPVGGQRARDPRRRSHLAVAVGLATLVAACSDGPDKAAPAAAVSIELPLAAPGAKGVAVSAATALPELGMGVADPGGFGGGAGLPPDPWLNDPGGTEPVPPDPFGPPEGLPDEPPPPGPDAPGIPDPNGIGL